MKNSFPKFLFREKGSFSPKPFEAWLKIFIFSFIIFILGFIFHFILYNYILFNHNIGDDNQENSVPSWFDGLDSLDLGGD